MQHLNWKKRTHGTPRQMGKSFVIKPSLQHMKSHLPTLSRKEHRQGIIRKLASSIAGINKVDVTRNEYRFRVLNPKPFKVLKATDFHGKLPKGIYVIRGWDGNHWYTQSVRFKKGMWTYGQALSWLRAHPLFYRF